MCRFSLETVGTHSKLLISKAWRSTLIIPVLGRQDREFLKFEVLLGYTGTLSQMRVFNNGLPKGSNLKIGKTEKLMGVLKKKYVHRMAWVIRLKGMKASSCW